MRRVVYDYNQADFPALRRALSESSLDISPTDNIDYCWEQWKVNFPSILSTFVPAKIVTDTNSPPWIDGEVRHLMPKKYTALRNYRKNKPRALCQQIKYAIRSKHKLYLAKIEASFKSNPKSFRMLRRHSIVLI